MNTRNDKKAAKLKKWISLAPGLIQKPLRHIGNRTNGYDGQGRIVLSTEFRHARQAADRGNGAYVQQMARALA